MDGTDIIAFLSDSGLDGGYVAVCEAMVARIRPEARIFHISHEIPVGDVGAAALPLERIAPLYPAGVHVSIGGPVVSGYGELRPGGPGAFCASWGQVAPALNSADAAQVLSLDRRMKVRLSPAKRSAARGIGG